MRILKILLKVLAILTVLFLLSGLIFPKTKYTTAQQINLPVETAFEVYTDASKMKQWYLG